MGGNHVHRYLRNCMIVACAGAIPPCGVTQSHAQQVATPRVATTPPDHARERRALLRVTVNADQAPLVEVLHTIARQVGLNPMFRDAAFPADSRVTLHVHNVTVAEAFHQALRGTGLMANVHESDVVIVSAVTTTVMTGILMGRVSDVTTKRPVRGASIAVDGGTKGVLADEDGMYRVIGISAGSHTVVVKMLGYARQTRVVTIGEAQTTKLDVALEANASALEQVVVTGTVAATALKAVPNAITVVTAKQIEERGITKIDQLFRGDIPGLFAQNQGSFTPLDEVTMFSRGATALSASSAGVSPFTGNTNPIKTYVDGVELADPKYFSQIDPQSIERIEILTGPQASTIYGSNAINGVMQIFTKRGTANTPRLTLNLLSGFVQNNFSSALTPQHDYSAQVDGLEGRMSYNAGGSWQYMGPWTPAKQTARTGGFGGMKLEIPTALGHVTADMTLRRTITQSRQRGATNQIQTNYRATGWWSAANGSGRTPPTTYTLTGQTLGMVLTYVPIDWWSHELGVGQDAVDYEQRYTARAYTSISDTTLYLQQNHTDRRSLRYTTTARIPLATFLQATLTAGADSWQNLATSMDVRPQVLTGTLTGTTDVSRQPGHNTGGFLQTQIGVNDQLFVTYGLRAEWNPNYGKMVQPNYAPRYGIAYSRDLATPFGVITAKLRGSYGRSTRPPAPTLKAAQTAAAAYGASDWSVYSLYYPNFDYSLANTALGPEYQQGGEGGLELYVGTRGSLVITRYNQTVDRLIDQPKVDSIRSFIPSPPSYNVLGTDGYGYLYQFQYVNIGSIRNQGWELQGSLNTGPFTTRGTYSWAKSRTLGVDARYRASFASSPQYQPGAPVKFLPEHTWALGVTYSRVASSLGLNVTGAGQVMDQNDDFFLRRLTPNVRLAQNRQSVTGTSKYISRNRGYVLADLTATHRLLPSLEGVFQLQNLMDHYTNDFNASFASMGRQIKAGFRWRSL